MCREYHPTIWSQPSISTSTTSETNFVRPGVTHEDLNLLMELDIHKGVVKMGFPEEKVRATVKRKMNRGELPFFNLEECIEAVLDFMEEEIHNQDIKEKISNKSPTTI